MEDDAAHFDSVSSPASQSAIEKGATSKYVHCWYFLVGRLKSQLTGALLENSDSNKIQKMTFSSLGSGQL